MSRKDPKQKTRHNARKCSCEERRVKNACKAKERLTRKMMQDHNFRFYIFVIFPNE